MGFDAGDAVRRRERTHLTDYCAVTADAASAALTPNVRGIAPLRASGSPGC
jgi:hypothetical protein